MDMENSISRLSIQSAHGKGALRSFQITSYSSLPGCDTPSQMDMCAKIRAPMSPCLNFPNPTYTIGVCRKD